MSQITIVSAKPYLDKATGQQKSDPTYGKSWYLTVQDEAKQTYNVLKSFKKDPIEGSVIDATIEEGTWPDGNVKYTLKMVPKPFNGSGGGSYKSDPNTMLLAYAKDIVVVCIDKEIIKTSAEIDATLDHYITWFKDKLKEIQ